MTALNKKKKDVCGASLLLARRRENMRVRSCVVGPFDILRGMGDGLALGRFALFAVDNLNLTWVHISYCRSR